MRLSNATVGKWRKRYRMQGIEGLHDELRSGRPRTHDDERVAEVINAALQTKPPDGSTHWSVRTMAGQTGVSKSTVQRWFSLFAVQPHRQRHFKLSNDPFFIEKVRDIVGLYLNPPDHAVVLCVDEKTQVQALNRTQPMLPMGLGYVERNAPHQMIPTDPRNRLHNQHLPPPRPSNDEACSSPQSMGGQFSTLNNRPGEQVLKAARFFCRCGAVTLCPRNQFMPGAEGGTGPRPWRERRVKRPWAAPRS